MQESLRQPVTHLVIDLVRGAQQQNAAAAARFRGYQSGRCG
jgi:hypothetical protein